MTSRRRMGDGGATTIEFAIVGPLLFLLILTMIDLGLVIIGNSVGSSAARDGARVGTVQYIGADVSGTEANDDIVEAVNARLVGLLRGTPTVQVRCLEGSSLSEIDCTKAAVTVDRDLIEVTVIWQHVGATPFVTSATHTEVSRLVIAGEVDLQAPPAPPLLISVSNASVVEGDPGDTTTLEFTIERSHNTTAATVQYATLDGPAPAATGGTTTRRPRARSCSQPVAH